MINLFALFVFCSARSPGHDVIVQYQVVVCDVHNPEDLLRQDRQDAFLVAQGARLILTGMLVTHGTATMRDQQTLKLMSGHPMRGTSASLFVSPTVRQETRCIVAVVVTAPTGTRTKGTPRP